MELELKIAMLGIIGTILGTVVGWLLNNISRTGKLNVYISGWNDVFQYNNNGEMTPSSSIEQTVYYRYELETDLYNSSADTKIMRNVEIIFMYVKHPIKISIPHDDATKVFRQHFTSYYDVEPINIPPKTVLKYKLVNSFYNGNDGLDFIWETTNIVLRYTNEKCKIKTIPIKTENYKTYFERYSCISEESANER